MRPAPIGLGAGRAAVFTEGLDGPADRPGRADRATYAAASPAASRKAARR
jgi:hypothetical protein